MELAGKLIYMIMVLFIPTVIFIALILFILGRPNFLIKIFQTVAIFVLVCFFGAMVFFLVRGLF